MPIALLILVNGTRSWRNRTMPDHPTGDPHMANAAPSLKSTPIPVSALLAQIEQASEGVMILTEGLARDEFLGSRLTRAEVVRQIKSIADCADRLSQQTRKDLAEPDWTGWEATNRRLAAPGVEADEALWFAVTSLAPATLMWLRVYRQSQPKLFVCDPAVSG